MMDLLITALIAYLLGSLSPSTWLGKLVFKRDLTKYGSKNPGASNAFYVFGKFGGAVVFFVDLLKGVLALYLADVFFFKGIGYDFHMLMFVASFFAVLGHCYSIFLKFRGGKGFATFLGVNLYHFPQVMLLLILLFAGVVLITKFISIGTFTLVTTLPLIQLIMHTQIYHLSGLAMFFMFATSVLIIWRHRENVVKLIKGTEISIRTPHISKDELGA